VARDAAGGVGVVEEGRGGSPMIRRLKLATKLQGFIGMVAIVLVCWAGMALAQPFPAGLPHCEAQLSACQAAAQTVPAPVQTTSWDSAGQVTSCAGTGQDGDIQAGASLSYTDNGDGTITDNNTKLIWEKQSINTGDIHELDNLYTWADAFAVHVAGL